MITHLVIHHPHPEHRADLLASMRRVDAAAEGKPGLVTIRAWSEIEGDRLLGIAVWESMEAFQAAAPSIFAVVADDPFDVWCAAPSERIMLEAD
jgi:heme-degrading monooxygenase HmoA